MLRLAVFVTACIAASQAAGWTYEEKWTMGSCLGKRQSPINIIPIAAEFNANLKVETFNFDTAPMTMSLSNNGHSAVVGLTQTDSNVQAYTMFQGKRFEPLQFHYHWGKTDDTGSEHFVDGKQWPMEMHVVHKNAAYNASEFLKHGDGALVLGFMIGKGAGSPASMKLTSKMGAIMNKDTSVAILNSPKLGELLPKDPASEIYYYEGSLTTPTCNEAVQWIVSKKELTMTEQQFSQFRKLLSHVEGDDDKKPSFDAQAEVTTQAKLKYISGNYRPLQAMNGRKVQRNFAHVGAPWDYDSDWTRGYCGGKRQSPINIITSNVQHNKDLKVETFNFDTAPMTMSLSNNGHSAVVGLTQTDSNLQAYTMFQGKRFEPLQFHYHWGKTDATGSEHIIDYKQWPMEVHIVHKNAAYNASEFLKHGDGALVLGFMVGKGPVNPAAKQITDVMGKIKNKDTTTDVPNAPKLGALVPKGATDEVFYYKGSLTTPDCQEAVQWILSNKQAYMDQAQFDMFRSLYGHKHGSSKEKYLSGNYRPVQMHNDRVVQTNFAAGKGDMAWMREARWVIRDCMKSANAPMN